MDSTNRDHARKIYDCFVSKDFPEAMKLIKENPKSLYIILYFSISCSGGYGLPVWKHFGYMLKNTDGYSKDQNVKDFALFLAQEVSSESSSAGSILLLFALTANWVDMVPICVEMGLDIKEDIQYINMDNESKEMQECLLDLLKK